MVRKEKEAPSSQKKQTPGPGINVKTAGRLSHLRQRGRNGGGGVCSDKWSPVEGTS